MRLNFDTLYQSIPQSPSAPFIFGRELTLADVINTLITYLFPIVGLLLLVSLIVGGFLLLTSGGDPKRIQVAKSVLTSSFSGFLVVFSAFWITQFIGIMLGVSEIEEVGMELPSPVPPQQWCQNCETMAEGVYANTAWNQHTNFVAQSFTSTCRGYFDYVSFCLPPLPSGCGWNMQIAPGETLDFGPDAYRYWHYIRPCGPAGAYHLISFNTNRTQILSQNSVYTIRINVRGDPACDVFGIVPYNNQSRYSGGRAYDCPNIGCTLGGWSNSADYEFRISVCEDY